MLHFGRTKTKLILIADLKAVVAGTFGISVLKAIQIANVLWSCDSENEVSQVRFSHWVNASKIQA